MLSQEELCELINSHSATNVQMNGQIDVTGIFRGHLRGSSTNELYEFLRYVAESRGYAFEQVAFRLGNRKICLNWIKKK